MSLRPVHPENKIKMNFSINVFGWDRHRLKEQNVYSLFKQIQQSNWKKMYIFCLKEREI